MTSPAVGTGIVAFIEARLAVREAVARDAHPGPWRYWLAPEAQSNGLRFGDVEADWSDSQDGSGAYVSIASGYIDDPGDIGQTYDASQLRPSDGEHIAANDPRRVLAEVAKDRAILALHRPEGDDTDETVCSVCWNGMPYPCQTVRLLAATDADHPAFRPEWKPVAT